MNGSVRIVVRGVHLELLVEGRYDVVYTELSKDETVTLVARDPQGRTASVSIDVGVLEEVPSAEVPLDGARHGRESEERVLAAHRL